MEVASEEGLNPNQITRWKKQYLDGKFHGTSNSDSELRKLKLKICELEQMLGKLTMENYLLKKRERIHSSGKKREFLSTIRARFKSLKEAARLMGMSRSSYYYKPKNKAERQKRDRDLCSRIRAIARRFPYYGYRRITHALRRKGTLVNHKKVLKLMRNMQIQVKRRRKFTSTTNSSHNLKVYPNLIKNLKPERIDQLWCSDITYIYLQSGFVYLAAIIDAFSRKIIGYCLGRTLAAELAIEALRMALKSRNTKDLIHPLR